MNNKRYTADDIKVIDRNLDDIKSVDISRDAFEKNLISATQCALEFARTLVENTLPDNIRYVVNPAASYDKTALEDNEDIYIDASTDRTGELYDTSEVVELLWRNGKVPEWINMFVESEDGKYTSIKLDCCGRYTSDKKNIYHAREGRAPYHVLGPPVPPGFELGKGGKYLLGSKIQDTH